jgi:MEDS: MEthanogen/methylotroph, DcmR Sensory domain
MTTIRPPTAVPRRPAHRALLYQTQDDYAATVVPFLLDGLEAGQSVWVAAPVANLETLHAELGDPPGLHLVDARDWYLRPARTLWAYLAFIDGQLAEGRSAVRLTGELHWPGDDQPLAREWLVYESMLDGLLAGTPVEVLCTYNQDLVPAPALREVRAIHQGVAGPGATVELPLPDGVGTARFEPLDVVGAVAHVEGRARRAGLAEADVQRLAAAAAEVLWDASERGPGTTGISTWEDGRDFSCQIEPGTAPTVDPRSGYLAPEHSAAEGWGLWLARQRSDLLEIGVRSGGLAVRLRARLSRSRRPRPGAPRPAR